MTVGKHGIRLHCQRGGRWFHKHIDVDASARQNCNVSCSDNINSPLSPNEEEEERVTAEHKRHDSLTGDPACCDSVNRASGANIASGANKGDSS